MILYTNTLKYQNRCLLAGGNEVINNRKSDNRIHTAGSFEDR